MDEQNAQSAEVTNQRTLLKVLDVAARERDADFVDLGRGDGGTRGIVFLFTLSDVTHPGWFGESEGDCGVVFSDGET